jgi:hydroxymethylbilane synthase
MQKPIRIGTRESQLAVWQASQVKQLLEANGYTAELVYIKSEGDIDLSTPLYEMGVQGVFTRSLDIALLNNRIDIAVHSMKDVPTQLPKGIVQAAILKRGPVHDLLVFKSGRDFLENKNETAIIATSSIRRKAQWLNRYPNHEVVNLRGNVNSRLQKLASSNWNAAIFAQAGLERIDLRPENSIVLHWMLPAPAQGAIMVVCRDEDDHSWKACNHFNDVATSLCTHIERDFLKTLLGGCSTPISALAVVKNDQIEFEGNILSLDGKQRIDIKKSASTQDSRDLGKRAALELLAGGGQEIANAIRHALS